MDIKIPVINAFDEIGDKKKSFAREQKFILKKQVKISVLKNTITEIKSRKVYKQNRPSRRQY